MPGIQGFASMDPARVKEIVTQGGKAVQAKGTGNKFTSETAKAAGEIGRAKRTENKLLRQQS